MKLFFKSLFVLGILFVISCQNQKDFVVANTYEEPQDPDTISRPEWTNVPEGLQATVASKYNRFVRNEVPEISHQNSWTGEAWKGERLSAQLVLWSTDSITNVMAEISDFKSDSGNILPKDIASISFVKYVITDEFGGGCGYRKPEDFAASLAADELEPVNTYAVRGQETRPVWITIDVPSNAEAGTYKSTFNLDIQGQKSRTFDLELRVIDKVLPPAIDWKFHLDLWQNPYAVARYHQVEPWSQEHWDLLKPLMKRLADAGQKVITASINKRPWGGQTYDPFDSMIEWRKKSDGSWEFNYTVFDQWVEMMMDLGVKKQINCYSMVPWGNEYYYFDEATNEEVKIKAAPGSKEYEELWVPFLNEFKAHLQEKGWDKITRIAMDERGPEEMKAMLKLLEGIAPEFGVSFADNHKSYKLYPDALKDMSVAFGHPVDSADLVVRKAKGNISTHYVCCSDKFPNTFTFSDPAEGVFIGWYTLAANFDGFLRWAYNSWVENPLLDSRFRAWPAGDTYIVYPDNRSSIRFETLREGIQDAEKIRILREELAQKGDTDELERLNTIVTEFDITAKPENLEKMLDDAKHELNVMAEK